MSSEIAEKQGIDYQLRGKTLEVYMYMLRHGNPLGIREIQRELKFSSPSIVVYHLDKLIRLGIVERDEYGRYYLAKRVDVGILSAFITVGRFSLPRLGFYAAFFTTIALAYILNGENSWLYGLIGSMGSALVFWYEAWRIWRRKPF